MSDFAGEGSKPASAMVITPVASTTTIHFSATQYDCRFNRDSRAMNYRGRNVLKILPWVGAAAVLAAGVLTFAQAGSAAEAENASTSLVEDFTHPGADTILSQYDLKVLTGDGGIMFSSRKPVDEGVHCPTAEIQVEKSLAEEPYGYYYCFKTFGAKGVLSLEVPGTFGLRAGNNPVVAKAKTDEGTEVYNIPANKPVPIDPGDGNELPDAILVEMRIG